MINILKDKNICTKMTFSEDPFPEVKLVGESFKFLRIYHSSQRLCPFTFSIAIYQVPELKIAISSLCKLNSYQKDYLQICFFDHLMKVKCFFIFIDHLYTFFWTLLIHNLYDILLESLPFLLVFKFFVN